MGRAKLKMELMDKEKSRNITFKKRREGLMRKMHEFTTLTDVSACMIIYGPKQDKGGVEPEVWPQNMDEIRRMIDIYKMKNKDSGNKTFGLSDFFHDRKRKIEEELSKVRKKNMEAKYPTWLDFMNGFTEIQLREFAANLSVKADYVKSRIDFLKRSKEGFDMSLMDLGRFNQSHSQPHTHNHSHNFYNPNLIQRGIEFEVINQQAISSVKPIEMHLPIHYPNIDHHQEMQHPLNPNPMMMLLLNENDHCLQFGGASTSGNISFKRQVFYEASASSGAMDPMICHSPKPLSRFYAPPMAPPPYVMPSVVPPQQIPFLSRENLIDSGGHEEIVEYQMKNSRNNSL